MRALSLKQPWATLLAHGLKCIEVRRWHTPIREQVLIHASRAPDERKEAWAEVPPQLLAEAEIGGGFIGIGELTGCRAYESMEAFIADQSLHLNAPDWFEEPRLYGFLFEKLRPIPFFRHPGWVRLFPVPEETVEQLRIS